MTFTLFKENEEFEVRTFSFCNQNSHSSTDYHPHYAVPKKKRKKNIPVKLNSK